MITFDKFQLNNFDKNLIITDKHIAEIYDIKGNNVVYLPRGEKAKTFAVAEKLCKIFLQRNLQKDDTVVAVGGGSIGDVVGFACSVYKRGIRLLHVPTTLLAQVDSSIGGKTAIDLCGVKNAVGTFYHADTLIDVNFIATLTTDQLESGKGEIIKYCMLCQDVAKLYDNGTLQQVIKACADYKQSICDRDFADGNIRHRLNLGHTVGHALELSHKLPHGVAVANGLYYETLLAYKLGKVSQEYWEKWQNVIANNYKLVKLEYPDLQLIVNDKKNENGLIGFVFPPQFDTEYLPYEQVEQLLLTNDQL